MKHTRRILAIVLALAGLCLVCLLTACKPEDAYETQPPSETEPAVEATYTITLKGTDGLPMSNVVLKVFKNGSEMAAKMVGENGIVVVTLPADHYTMKVEAPDGSKLYYDVDAASLTPDCTEASLCIFRGASDTWTLNAPSQKTLDNSYAEIPAPFVEAFGSTYIEFNKDEYTYVVFNPTRPGYHTFSVPDGVEFAYYGMPIMIYDAPRLSPNEKGVITIPVEASSLGGDGISQLVFRFKATDTYTEEGFLFTVAHDGELVKTPEELATWITIEADRSALDALSTFKEPVEGDKWASLTAGTLTNLNLKDADLAVVLGSDGYYHLGAADGPMVFVRITSDSPYIEDFVKMCETDHLRAYFYDENGTFLRKEGYNSLFNAYGEVANADGVVPLNEQLAYAIQNVGRHMGWWNFDVNSDIFGDEVYPVSVAWLFACAVYQ